MSSAAARLGLSALPWGLPSTLLEHFDPSIFPTKVVARRGAPAKYAEAADHWRLNPGSPAATLEDALACLVWAYMATVDSKPLDDESSAAVVAKLAELQPQFRDLNASVQPLAQLWLRVELPLILLRSLPRKSPEAEVQSRQIADELAAAWPAWMDGEGLPRCTVVPHAWALLASWLRCAWLWRDLELPGWNDNLFEQFDLLLQQSLRLLRSDGSVLFEPPGGVRPSREFIAAAVEFVGRAETQWFAACAGVFPERQVSPKAKQAIPLISDYADASGLAILRSEWGGNAVQAGLAFHGKDCRCELSTGKQTFVSGSWRFEVKLNGELCPPQGPWREVVWFSDEEVDYLEIEIDLTDEWRVQRQLLLYRPEKLFFLADAVLGEGPGEMEYRGFLPLQQGVSYVPAADSHDGRIADSRSLATVLPLALPEWRASASAGSLETDGSSLIGSIRGQGRGLYMPLVVACNRPHQRQPFTWRRLTVAEWLHPVSSDVACGYRTQFGRNQLLFYRSLAPAANRTVLGQNVACDFLAAEFKADGTARPIVRIET
ncbi:MAG: hypothetical protein U1A77_12875 [Pirellulales bacterium]